ncbi:MAG: crossover junction endodeoxyribonuclease RuvC [Patescibacteria group bacterium]
MRILGIDPGTVRIGYGLVDDTKGVLSPITYGVIETTSKGIARIYELGVALRELIKRHNPEVIGIETIYFAKNQKTALSVSEARGAMLFIAQEAGLPIYEIRPGDVKLSVAGYGAADKLMVAKMVKKILTMDEVKGHDDASDALAIAIATSSLLKRERLGQL